MLLPIATETSPAPPGAAGTVPPHASPAREDAALIAARLALLELRLAQIEDRLPAPPAIGATRAAPLAMLLLATAGAGVMLLALLAPEPLEALLGGAR